MQRREFIKRSLAVSATSMMWGIPMQAWATTPDAVWISGAEPAELLSVAFQNLGGISQFVSRGDVVVIKPNIGWDRKPEMAANTNPDLIGALVKLCKDAGAKKVKIFDRTCNNPQRCYQNSQIESLAKQSGAEVEQIRDFRFKKISLPGGELLKEWQIYQDYLEADKVINVPIAKHHSLSKVTMGLKNLMGVMGGNRGEIHNNFNQKLIDISTHILPTLTIIDAYRILIRNGPSGGNVNDTKLVRTLIASSCTVSADYLALELFNLPVQNVGHIQEALERGLNKYDPRQLQVKRVQLG